MYMVKGGAGDGSSISHSPPFSRNPQPRVKQSISIDPCMPTVYVTFSAQTGTNIEYCVSSSTLSILSMLVTSSISALVVSDPK